MRPTHHSLSPNVYGASGESCLTRTHVPLCEAAPTESFNVGASISECNMWAQVRIRLSSMTQVRNTVARPSPKPLATMQAKRHSRLLWKSQEMQGSAANFPWSPGL